jgi:hypothetical protein
MWLSKEPRYEKISRLLSLHGQTGTTNGIERAQNGKSSSGLKNICHILKCIYEILMRVSSMYISYDKHLHISSRYPLYFSL